MRGQLGRGICYPVPESGSAGAQSGGLRWGRSWAFTTRSHLGGELIAFSIVRRANLKPRRRVVFLQIRGVRVCDMTRAGAEPTRNLTRCRGDPAVSSSLLPGCIPVASLVVTGCSQRRAHLARRVGSKPCRAEIGLGHRNEPELSCGRGRSWYVHRTTVLLPHPTWCNWAPNNDVRGLHHPGWFGSCLQQEVEHC